MALNLTKDEVARAYAELLPKLRQQGAEWRGAPCPIHGGDDPENFVVNATTGAFRCFSGGCKGDVVDVAMKVLDLSKPKDALDQVEAMVGRAPGGPGAGGGRSPAPPPPPPTKSETSEWAGPLPFGDCPPPTKTWRGKTSGAFDGFGRRAAFKCVMTWPYYDAQGLLLRMDVRQEAEGPDGTIQKDVVPYTVWRDKTTGALAWRQKDIPRELPNSRPLWGLHELAQRPEALVLVCEGCKAAQAARAHFPELVAIAWPGGTGGVRHAEWGALAGRKVVFWPDADEGGLRAAQEGAQLALAAGATSAEVVQVPEGAPEGWDLADAVPEGWDLRALLVGAQAHEAEASTEAEGAAARLPENQAAERTAAALKWRLRYGMKSDAWWAYQAERGVWAEVSKAEAQSLMAKAIRETGCAPKGYGSRYVDSVLTLAREFLRAPDVWGLAEAFANGVLEGGVLKPHDPKRMLVFVCPFAWVPGVDPKPFLDFLLRLANGDPQVVELFRAATACILRGENPEVFLELQGVGATGKSTLLRIWVLLIGHLATFSTSLPMLETRPFELANARGKRLVQINDADDYRGGVSNLKQLTGGDLVRAEEKGKQRSEPFRFGGLVVITANKPLRSSDYSSGLARRRITHTPTQPVPAAERRDLEAEFTPLLPGIYAWAMALSAEEAKRILRTARERVKAIAEATAAAEEDANPIAAWGLLTLWLDPDAKTEMGVASWVPPQRQPDGSMTEGHFAEWDSKLYPSFCQWAKTSGFQQMSATRFGGDLGDLLGAQWRLPGVAKFKDWKGRRGWVGIALRAGGPTSRPVGHVLKDLGPQGANHGDHGDLKTNPPWGSPWSQSVAEKDFPGNHGDHGGFIPLLRVEPGGSKKNHAKEAAQTCSAEELDQPAVVPSEAPNPSSQRLYHHGGLKSETRRGVESDTSSQNPGNADPTRASVQSEGVSSTCPPPMAENIECTMGDAKKQRQSAQGLPEVDRLALLRELQARGEA